MRDSIEDAMMDVPDAQCPECGRWEPDYDGFGILAHTTPAYEHGCGYCSHPSWTDGACSICGLWDAHPFASPGTLLLITTNIGLPMIVRVTEPENLADGGAGWACIWGAFKGKWITPSRQQVRRILKDGDMIDDDPRHFRVEGGSLVEINRP